MGSRRRMPSEVVMSAKADMLARGAPCWYCGRVPPPTGGYVYLTVEHIVAVAGGGDDHPRNLVPAHMRCNGYAGAMMLCEKWRLRRRMRTPLDELPIPNAALAALWRVEYVDIFDLISRTRLQVAEATGLDVVMVDRIEAALKGLGLSWRPRQRDKALPPPE